MLVVATAVLHCNVQKLKILTSHLPFHVVETLPHLSTVSILTTPGRVRCPFPCPGPVRGMSTWTALQTDLSFFVLHLRVVRSIHINSFEFLEAFIFSTVCVRITLDALRRLTRSQDREISKDRNHMLQIR